MFDGRSRRQARPARFTINLPEFHPHIQGRPSTDLVSQPGYQVGFLYHLALFPSLLIQWVRVGLIFLRSRITSHLM